jgi:Tfp pilus assembly protein PilX
MNSRRVIRSFLAGARDESGMALLISVVLLLLMSALGLSALQHAQDEAVSSGRARRKDATLYAAEAGLALVQERLLSNWGAAQVAPFSINESSLVRDAYDNPIAVRSGRPENSTPAVIAPASGASAAPPDGFMVNLGNQGAQAFTPIRADIVATDQANGMVHLQAQYRVHEGSGGGSY